MTTPRTKHSPRHALQKESATPKSRSGGRDRFAGADPKLAAFIRKHWPAKGRAQRIVRAEKAWKEAVEIASTFKNIDDETWKWIAQSKELEDI
ncbi:MAG: hypothetical protein IVW54_21010 [Candidatus Binataceae bacterium]|nr:hypothetical protein [Candidatus Binataceae bacterium]